MWAHGSRSLSIATTKLLASAVLGLVGAIGTANAATVLTSSSVEIWNATQADPGQFDPSQLGLPTATTAFGGPVGGIASTIGFVAPINYNLGSGGTDTIGGFFASDSPTTSAPATCGTACQATKLSGSPFVTETVFEFVFTTTSSTLLTITHDDGVSLFTAGTETNNCTIASCPGDFYATFFAESQTARTDSVTIGPGTYDLWYEEVNGLPAVLEASCSPSCQTTTPLPAALPLFATGLGGLGLLGWRRKRKAQAVSACPL